MAAPIGSSFFPIDQSYNHPNHPNSDLKNVSKIEQNNQEHEVLQIDVPYHIEVYSKLHNMVIKYLVKAQLFPTNYYREVFDKDLNSSKVRWCLYRLLNAHDEL